MRGDPVTSMSSFDAVLRKEYMGALRDAVMTPSFLPDPPPMQGPREPDAVVLFEGTDIRVERRCNGVPVVSVRDREYGDWVEVDRDDAAELAAALREF